MPWCGFCFLWFVFCEWVGGWLLVSDDAEGKKGTREGGMKERRREGGREGESELVGFLRALCVCVCVCG